MTDKYTQREYDLKHSNVELMATIDKVKNAGGTKATELVLNIIGSRAPSAANDLPSHSDELRALNRLNEEIFYRQNYRKCAQALIDEDFASDDDFKDWPDVKTREPQTFSLKDGTFSSYNRL
jgi:hypothetical protein